jgi:phosphoribosylamine--glycine ligase
VTPNVHARVLHEIVLPTIAGMAAEERPFVGFLYVGLMIDANGTPRTVEFNCRLGDPEAQVILMRLKSDLFDLLMQATSPSDAHPLDAVDLHWDRRVALGVVMAADGYPATPRTGDIVSGLADIGSGEGDADTVKVFHAATALRDGSPVTSGGRVLCVTALGESTRQAQQHAYHAVEKISFAGAQWRTDIGQRALRRLTP